MRGLLNRVAGLLAHAVDPLRSVRAIASLVQDANAGAVIYPDGATAVLPGMVGHPLLAAASPAVAVARAELGSGRVYQTFLWPLGGRHAPQGHVRFTALAPPAGLPGTLTGLLLLSPPGDLHRLTPRELEVLGLVIEGCSNRQIARVLVLTQRTVASHMERILAKLAAPSRTLAAVRAQRAGLYVPRARRQD
jgi:DNA-binding CsgD family transcriptional regulator